MGRTDTFRQIDGDSSLKEEILTKLADDGALPERLGLATVEGIDRERGLESFRSTSAKAPVDLARELIENPPEIPTDFGLEAIIMVMGRPVLLIRDDNYDLAELETETWRHRLEQARPNLVAPIRSVGRIELDNSPQFDWVGTGWVVADDVIVTNRHVASVFAHRVGDRFAFRTSFLGPMGARLDFAEEVGGDTPAEFRLADVLHIEEQPGPDMAFLRVDWTSNNGADKRTPIRLAAAESPTHNVAVIGYPAKDTRTSIPEEMDRIFGDVYNVKRLAPGDVTDVLDFGQIVAHDCTTLGGNSGSALVDIETGEAVALHFAGKEKDHNYAVAASVVSKRLEQIEATQSVAGPVVSPTVEELEPEPSIDQMEGRSGYMADFLGPEVSHPELAGDLRDALAPVAGRDDGILDYTHYSVRMHRLRRLAMYTAVNVMGNEARNVRRGRDKWRIDTRIAPEHQIGNELYRHNKLDRGHLVRRLDPAWGTSFEDAKTAALDTFYYTNCAPQHKTLNRDLWLRLEDHILSNANVRDLRVSVFTGPIFRDVDRKYRDFLIPEDFWKVVAMVNDETGRLSITGYILSQRDFMDDLEFAFGAFRTYQVPVATIEEQTGLGFGSLKDHDPLAEIETLSVRPLELLAEIVT